MDFYAQIALRASCVNHHRRREQQKTKRGAIFVMKIDRVQLIPVDRCVPFGRSGLCFRVQDEKSLWFFQD
jgi:hypothetical protein